MMDKARDLFDAAVSIARPLREGYVRRHAADDEALMNEVLRLLEFDEPTTEHAGSPREGGQQPGAANNADQTDRSPVRGYRLTQRQPDWHGGELWLAEPTGSSGGGRVFISLLPRPDSIRAALSRWRLVRPQLDALTTPTLVRIVEAGRTTDDRLFLVMPAFLPLTLNDWLLHHKPSAAEMLTVLQKMQFALAELASWGMLHGDVTVDSIRLRASALNRAASASGREAGGLLAGTEPVVDVQLIGTGVMQILATHTAKGRALSVDGDRAGVIEVARRMVGELLHRAGMEAESDAGGLLSSSNQEAVLKSADPAVRALVAMTGSQMCDDGGSRITAVSKSGDDQGFFRTGVNKLWGDAVHPVAAAAVAGTLAGVLALIGILLLLEFGGLLEEPPNRSMVVLLVMVCFACSAIASGVLSFVGRVRVQQERKYDAGVRRS